MGLRFGDLIIKNTALVFKWWWCFLNEKDSFWKKVVVSNYYNNPNCESHDVEHGEKGGLWGQIISPSYNVHEINEVIFNGLWRKIGKGNSTLF